MDFKKITRDKLKEEASSSITNIPEPAEMEFYSSPEWNKVKNSYKKNHQLCELCLNEGNKTPCSDIHHIKPVSLGGEPLSIDNLIALCKDCHSDVHSDTTIFEIGFDASSDSPILTEQPKTFKTKVIGGKDKNSNGTDRQQIIAQCMKGEMLDLVKTQTPYKYEKDVLIDGVGVFRKSGEQIGYIDYSVNLNSYLLSDMEHGAEVKAKILEISGSPQNYECIIEITKGELNWELEDKCSKKDQKARKLIRKAKPLEKNKPDKAISLYKQAMVILKEIDKDCKDIPQPFRWERYPINRLTMVLERNERYHEYLEEIEKCESIDDRIGLDLTGNTNLQLRKRKTRIVKKLSKLN